MTEEEKQQIREYLNCENEPMLDQVLVEIEKDQSNQDRLRQLLININQLKEKLKENNAG